jgi:hypothetical protein
LGSNPILPDSDVKRYQTLEFEPSGSSGLTGVTTVTVSGYISGAICENTKIKDIYNKDLLTSSITALVGDPVNIESTGEFDSMTITFKYTDDLNENYLRVMWFDEENLDYVVLNDYTINRSSNTISINTTHFSKYMLIDESIWVNTWGDNMAMTKDTTALGSASTLSGYKSRMGRLNDEDSDGLPDIFETNGMLIQTGNVIYTDPNDPDSDKDGIMDGEEMGILNLSRIIFDRSPFNDYIDEWYAGYGYREWEYAYFKMESNPTRYSSDPDTASDKEDETIYDENEPINYILIGKDKPNNDAVSSMRQPYIDAFKALGQTVIVLDIYEGSEYQKKVDEYYESIIGHDLQLQTCLLAKYTFSLLQHNLDSEVITDKLEYSKVDKMIIISHGDNNFIQFDPDDSENGYFCSEDINNMNYIACDINLVDIQACKCGDYKFDEDLGRRTCVAHELANKTNINKVYAWCGTAAFEKKGNYNYSWFGSYRVFYLYQGDITYKTMVSSNGWPWTFGPLEY